MASYFFPMLLIKPEFEGDSIDTGEFVLRKRKWDVTVFDLATLSVSHTLHLDYGLINIFLNSCNLEIEVKQAASKEEALHKIQLLRFILNLYGVNPFTLPYYSTHSINEYAGINSRDSKTLISKLPEELQTGITSKTVNIECWPLELTLQVIYLNGKLMFLREFQFVKAADDLKKWEELEKKHSNLETARLALITAPQIFDDNSSILHLWQGIESLFPNVSMEVSFRVSLLLAQLRKGQCSRLDIYAEIKRRYIYRSKLAHGAKIKEKEDWKNHYRILLTSLQAVLERNHLPTEEALIIELLED